MIATETLVFNIGVFISGLFLLEKGANIFVDNTALLASSLKIPSVLIALLTAGAEWEELAVVVASLVQRRSGLAVGNVVGSCISNILGAFSLGLLVQSGVTTFDRSSKLYTAILFSVTSIVSILAIVRSLTKPVGGVLVAAFAVYIALVCWSIYRGILAAPEDSDSDSDSDAESASTTSSNSGINSALHPSDSIVGGSRQSVDESSPLLSLPERKQHRNSSYLLNVLLGFAMLTVSGYILSHSAGTLARGIGISDSVFGTTVLSLATTLPEKFVAVLAQKRGQKGILVANTVGSNIFLLTLCLGVVLLACNGNTVVVSTHEVAWLWASAGALLAIVSVGSQRLLGVILLIAYIAFLVLEITMFRR